MKVLREGHRYELSNFDNKKAKGQEIQFIEKVEKIVDEGTNYFARNLVTINDGTTNEEVIEVLIDRLQYLNSKLPCRENSIAITKLEEALMWLNKRTAYRVAKGVEGTNNDKIITLREWAELHKNIMSQRLHNVLLNKHRGSLFIDNYPLDVVVEKDILSLRNAGWKTWEEFEELRERYLKHNIGFQK